MSTWYQLERPRASADNPAPTTELMIFDEIGMWGVEARTLVQDLMTLDPVEALTVRVNSPGGDVFDGVAIMNALRSHRGTVTVVVEGLAASAASVIAVGGADHLIMRPTAELMVHDAWQIAAGNAAEMEANAERLNRTSDNMARVYAAKAGGTVEQWREAMRAESWFSADEAVLVGLADQVMDARDVDVPDVVAAAPGRVFALAGKFNHRRREDADRPAIINQATTAGKKGDMTLMKDVAARLGLTSTEIDEDTVLAALDEALAEQTTDETNHPADTEDTPDNDEGPTDTDDEDPGPSEDPTGDPDAAPAAADDTDGLTDEDTENVTDQDDNVIHLDKDVYEDLLTRAAAGDSAAAQDHAARAAALIEDDGIKTGRLLGWQRDQWVARATEDYDATRAALHNLAPGIVPLAEAGRGGSDEDRDASENRKGLRAAADSARFAPKPTV
ncbi:MAG TPA: hypothetical protein DCL06_11240 [Corynebacterium variabile]|uniref:ATP-dependent Clp protease proteolytic subunit n=1 Tax=Corynebacterium variabile TaxID=1727 RepID=A0A3B9QWC7_9CORY|nr:hypothetical protein [Corynebacterium variabile]